MVHRTKAPSAKLAKANKNLNKNMSSTNEKNSLAMNSDNAEITPVVNEACSNMSVEIALKEAKNNIKNNNMTTVSQETVLAIAANPTAALNVAPEEAFTESELKEISLYEIKLDMLKDDQVKEYIDRWLDDKYLSTNLRKWLTDYLDNHLNKAEFKSVKAKKNKKTSQAVVEAPQPKIEEPIKATPPPVAPVVKETPKVSEPTPAALSDPMVMMMNQLATLTAKLDEALTMISSLTAENARLKAQLESPKPVVKVEQQAAPVAYVPHKPTAHELSRAKVTPKTALEKQKQGVALTHKEKRAVVQNLKPENFPTLGEAPKAKPEVVKSTVVEKKEQPKQSKEIEKFEEKLVPGKVDETKSLMQQAQQIAKIVTTPKTQRSGVGTAPLPPQKLTRSVSFSAALAKDLKKSDAKVVPMPPKPKRLVRSKSDLEVKTDPNIVKYVPYQRAKDCPPGVPGKLWELWKSALPADFDPEKKKASLTKRYDEYCKRFVHKHAGILIEKWNTLGVKQRNPMIASPKHVWLTFKDLEHQKRWASIHAWLAEAKAYHLPNVPHDWATKVHVSTKANIVK